jgi:hypothetical protein
METIIDEKGAVVSVSQLTPQQRRQLMRELEEEQKAEQAKKLADRDTYKQLVNEVTLELFPMLTNASRALLAVKQMVFDRFADLVCMKGELYGVKDSQQSHTFTTADGDVSITIGYRVTDAYDDTVEAGISIVKEYITSLAKDTESAALVETVMRLLSKDKKGNLKASRVMELEQIAIRTGNDRLIEGLHIIKEAYRPAKSCNFIEVKYKNEEGKQMSLPLSISAVE